MVHSFAGLAGWAAGLAVIQVVGVVLLVGARPALLALVLLPAATLPALLLWVKRRGRSHTRDLMNLPGPAVQVDPQGLITGSNMAWRQLLVQAGFKADTRRLAILLPGLSFAACPNQGMGCCEEDVMVQAPGGRSYRWRLTWGPGGQAGPRTLLVRDITEEQRLVEVGQLLRACVSHIHDTIIVTQGDPLDEPGPRIVFVNEALERLTGYSRDELVGRSPRLLQGAQTDRRALDRVRQALQANQPIQEVLINYTRQGETFWNEMNIVPVPADGAGGAAYFVAIGRDVSARREQQMRLQRSEQALRELNRSEQAVREEERTRIARDLHDDLGQRLTALKLDLGLLLEAKPGLAASQRQKLGRLVQSVDAGIEQIRDIAADLRPSLLDHAGFREAAEWFVEEARPRLAADIFFSAGPGTDQTLPEKVATALYRILQEAFTNIGRHSNAQRVTVSYFLEAGMACLCVQDDGRGFDLPVIQLGQAFGLLGMQERAEALGGSLKIATAVGQGCLITTRIPLNDEKNTTDTGR